MSEQNNDWKRHAVDLDRFCLLISDIIKTDIAQVRSIFVAGCHFLPHQIDGILSVLDIDNDKHVVWFMDEILSRKLIDPTDDKVSQREKDFCKRWEEIQK